MTKTKKQQALEDWRLYLSQTREFSPNLAHELKCVVDLYHTVHTGLEANFDKLPSDAIVLELTKIVLQRWDNAEERKRRDEQEEIINRRNQAQGEDDND